jgi:hypothetical protein
MTWPGAPTLLILAACIGVPLAARLWRRARPLRMLMLPGVTVHRCGCTWCPRHTAVRAERDRLAAEHARWAREMHEQWSDHQ